MLVGAYETMHPLSKMWYTKNIKGDNYVCNFS